MMRIVVIYYNIGIASGHGHSTETLIFTLKDNSIKNVNTNLWFFPNLQYDNPKYIRPH